MQGAMVFLTTYVDNGFFPNVPTLTAFSEYLQHPALWRPRTMKIQERSNLRAPDIETSKCGGFMGRHSPTIYWSRFLLRTVDIAIMGQDKKKTSHRVFHGHAVMCGSSSQLEGVLLILIIAIRTGWPPWIKALMRCSIRIRHANQDGPERCYLAARIRALPVSREQFW
ncbi:hypothetical protein DFH06DRAFT_114880 [Mycena polygramma]|nr:hypothetical protein DFH06DRAFT_114880 [Mycena polygramma]